MKIYVHDNGVTLAGKAWEIKRKLKEYGQEHKLVTDWIKTVNKKALRSD
ncbi:MAG TPA: Z-ring formation inhibitor MciZ [Bacillus bacterium]|nr:Z-ring formation inhibitor MciZ [Bacillus sp. (in: firmicutes)]